MTFKKAYEIAVSENAEMKIAKERVDTAVKNGEPSGIFLFAVSGEVFYIGYDGKKLFTGKHNAKRAREIIRSGYAAIVR